MPKVIRVIQSEIHRGKGTEKDVCRLVLQYHTEDGEFLAENDPYFCSQEAFEEQR